MPIPGPTCSVMSRTPRSKHHYHWFIRCRVIIIMTATCGISVRDFCLGIETNSVGVVKAYLSIGGDPNVPVDGDTPIVGDCAIVRRKSFMPLHLAVVNCYRLVEMDNDDSWRIAIAIIDHLLKAGANLDATTSFVLREAADLTRGGRSRTDYTPLSLALLLKKELKLMEGARHPLTSTRLDQLLEILLPTPKATIQKLLTSASLPQSVATTYKKLLFSPEQSDLTFLCSDGEEITAHKAVLAASSSYFASAFSGPWQENNKDGEWKTSYSSTTIKAVLTFVYTGGVDGIRENPVKMLSIADEWNMLALKEVATAFCIESMSHGANSRSLEKFTEMLQLAHLQQIEDLKTACLTFAKKNAALVLTNTGIASLQNDNVALWDELHAFITCEGTDDRFEADFGNVGSWNDAVPGRR